MVGNLFIRLYLLIVFSIIVIGVGTNWVWKNYYEDDNSTTSILEQTNSVNPYRQYENLILLVALQLEFDKSENLKNKIDAINEILFLNFSLSNTNEFPPELFKNSQNEKPLLLSSQKSNLSLNKETQLSLFLLLANHQKILQLVIPAGNSITNASANRHDVSRNVFLVIFYTLVAATILYWILPLSKDLNRLQHAVKNFDNQHLASKVNIPASSSIAHLANAYNKLLDKIKMMIDSEKSMANSISHELRTPLARVRFALQMAKESNDSSFIYEKILSAEDDVNEMNQLITELLNFASINNQAFEAHFSRGDLAALVLSLTHRLKTNHPNVIINFVNELEVTDVSCDENLMGRAIQNLIINACKYGNGEVLVKLLDNGTHYKLSVENNGDKIADQQKGKIFEAFYQIQNNNKQKGFGVGLSIVSKIAALHQGEVTVGDSPLGGAKFVIQWPNTTN